MITLEQIRLLEGKITRAIDLIRVLKDENSTLRKGLESAQRRMRELETLVDGFKTDQKEIESVIVRTLHNLDELEESAATAATPATAGGIPAGGISPGGIPAATSAVGAVPAGSGAAQPAMPATPSPLAGIPASSGGTASRRAEARAGGVSAGPSAPVPQPAAIPQKDEPPAPKEELDIF
jgi:hypothetical protein